MKARGRSKGNKKFQKGHSSKFKTGKQKPRKTYSLFKDKSKWKNSNKPKTYQTREDETPKEYGKRSKIQEEVPASVLHESSDSESEQEDAMKQLRNALKTKTKASMAIDSSDDSDLEDENSKHNVNTDNENNVGTDDESEIEMDNESEIEMDNESEIEMDDESDVESDCDVDPDNESAVAEARSHVKINSKRKVELTIKNDTEDVSIQLQNKSGKKIKNNLNGEEIKNSTESCYQSDNEDLVIDEGEVDLETQKEDENITTLVSVDPFSKHVLYEISEELLNSVQSTPMKTKTHIENWSALGKLAVTIPICEETKSEKSTFAIQEDKLFAPCGKVPLKIDSKKDTPQDIFIKSQLFNNLKKANLALSDDELSEKYTLPLTQLQSELFSIFNNYQDLYYPQRTFDNAEQIRFAYCLHAVNHILKTRTKVLHHNARLSNNDDVPEEFRDQGLVRPKILIVVPFRDSAYKIINMITELFFLEDKGNVINKNRFINDYTGHELVLPKKNPKPEDYELIFKGNSNDDFKIGITVTKKSLKLYADFYSSDIIIASPLGLRYTIGAVGEPDRDFDFLASIELLILDQMEIFLMQNFHHVLHILDHLHVQPKDSHGTNFARVRHWSINGWAKYYRQTLMFSSMVIPEVSSIFSKYCSNYAGKVAIMNPVENGSINQVFVQLPHIFQKFEASSLLQAIDARFDFFVRNVLPEHRDPLMKQTLIFVPNYYDYVRLRNYFKREDISFVQICEYSKDAKVARARDMFYHGDAHFLLYTERYHFFNRIRLKGIRHIIFYQPPVFPHFYYEMSNFMMESNMNKKIGSILNMSVTVLYCKYDGHQLASTIGTERAGKMLQSTVNVHKILIRRS